MCVLYFLSVVYFKIFQRVWYSREANSQHSACGNDTLPIMQRWWRREHNNTEFQAGIIVSPLIWPDRESNFRPFALDSGVYWSFNKHYTSVMLILVVLYQTDNNQLCYLNFQLNVSAPGDQHRNLEFREQQIVGNKSWICSPWYQYVKTLRLTTGSTV